VGVLAVSLSFLYPFIPSYPPPSVDSSVEIVLQPLHSTEARAERGTVQGNYRRRESSLIFCGLAMGYHEVAWPWLTIPDQQRKRFVTLSTTTNTTNSIMIDQWCLGGRQRVLVSKRVGVGRASPSQHRYNMLYAQCLSE
jgi:hypothetical protein